MLFYFLTDEQIQLFIFDDLAHTQLKRIVDFTTTDITKNDWTLCGDHFDIGKSLTQFVLYVINYLIILIIPIRLYVVEEMERLENWNSPRGVEYSELKKFHQVKNEESHVLSHWERRISVQVGDDGFNYHLDCPSRKPGDLYAHFYYYLDGHKGLDIAYNNNRDHYVVRVDFFCTDSPVVVKNDEDKGYKISGITIAKRSYSLL